AEQFDEAVSESDDAPAIRRPPAGKLVQSFPGAWVASGARDQLGQHRSIAQTKVKALSGHWVQRLSRVADECYPSRDSRGGACELQRIRGPPARTHETTRAPAEALLQLG